MRTSTLSIRDVFRKWDADGSGMLDFDEFKQALAEMGVQLDDADLQASRGRACALGGV